MTITNNTKIAVEQTSGVVPELALVEAGANLTESVPVTMTGIADAPDWTYSATAEDNGTAGNLDGQPGLTYSGPATNHFRVKITNFDTIEHAITLPRASPLTPPRLLSSSTSIPLLSFKRATSSASA